MENRSSNGLIGFFFLLIIGIIINSFGATQQISWIGTLMTIVAGMGMAFFIFMKWRLLTS